MYEEEEEEGNVRTYKILGSLEILAIKKNNQQHNESHEFLDLSDIIFVMQILF